MVTTESSPEMRQKGRVAGCHRLDHQALCATEAGEFRAPDLPVAITPYARVRRKVGRFGRTETSSISRSARSCLGEVERHLMALDEGSGDAETVNATSARSIRSRRRRCLRAAAPGRLRSRVRGAARQDALERDSGDARPREVLTARRRRADGPDPLLQSGTELPQDREAGMKAALETWAGRRSRAGRGAPAAPAPAPKPAAAAAPKAAAGPVAAPPAAPAEPVPVSHRYRIVFAPRADMSSGPTSRCC